MALTLTGVDVRPYTHPLGLRTARGAFGERRGWHLTLRAGDRVGHGDAAPWPGFGADAPTVEAALAALDLTGRPVPVDHPAELRAFLRDLALPSPAAYAVELALADLAAARRGLSLARLLSPGATAVVTHRLVDTPADARAAVAAGYTTLKVKVAAAPLQDDAARVGAIRDAAPTAALRLDANGGWDRSTATAALAALGRHAPSWIEQPLAPHDRDGLRLLRARSPIPIALDESVALWGEAALDPDTCDAVVLKPMFVGGLHGALALARRARARGLMVCVTHALESPVGRRGALHLAAAVGEGIHGVGDRPVEPVPTAPGLGVAP
ncbi:MAG: o-succinylbenzoate synthase [Myxococcales bacterium]|nr:o-succinylbenzoate synthase [Myxococcales bacterium]